MKVQILLVLLLALMGCQAQSQPTTLVTGDVFVNQPVETSQHIIEIIEYRQAGLVTDYVRIEKEDTIELVFFNRNEEPQRLLVGDAIYTHVRPNEQYSVFVQPEKAAIVPFRFGNEYGNIQIT